MLLTSVCININEENFIYTRRIVPMHVDLHKHGLDQITAIENSDKIVLLMVPNDSFGDVYPSLHNSPFLP